MKIRNCAHKLKEVTGRPPEANVGNLQETLRKEIEEDVAQYIKGAIEGDDNQEVLENLNQHKDDLKFSWAILTKANDRHMANHKKLQTVNAKTTKQNSTETKQQHEQQWQPKLSSI